MATTRQVTPTDAKRQDVPLLEPGDRLTRAEFERRYEAMPDVKAELIEGIVYMPAAVRYRRHGQPHLRLITWLGTYEARTSGVLLSGNMECVLEVIAQGLTSPEHANFVQQLNARVKFAPDEGGIEAV